MTQSIFLPAVPLVSDEDRKTLPAQPPTPTWGGAISTAIDDKYVRMARWIDNLFFRPDDNAYDREQVNKGWSYSNHWQEAEKGLSWHNIEYLRENGASGPAAMQRAREEALRREEMDGYWAQAGIGKAIAGNLIAEFTDPTAWAFGLGTAKVLSRTALGVGRLAAAGRPGAAIAAAGAEAAVGEIAFTAFQDWTGEVFGVSDYLVAGAAGVVLGSGVQGAMSRGAFRRAAEKRLIEDAERMARDATPPDHLDPETADAAKVKDAQDAVTEVQRTPTTEAVIPEDLQTQIRNEFDGTQETPAPTPAPTPTQPVPTEAPRPPDPEVGPAAPPPVPRPTEAPKPPTVEVEGQEIPVPDVDDAPLTPERVIRVVTDLSEAGDRAGALRLVQDYIRDAIVNNEVDNLAEVLALRDKLETSGTATQIDPGGAEAAVMGDRIRAVRSGTTTVVLEHLRRIGKSVGPVLQMDRKRATARKSMATKNGLGWREVSAADALKAAMDANPVFTVLRPVIDRLLAQPDSLANMRVLLVSETGSRGEALETGVAVSPATTGTGLPLPLGGDLRAVLSGMGKWSSETMIHELIHSATQHITKMAGQAHTRMLLSPQVLEAIETVEDVLVRLRERIAQDGDAPRNVQYAATNIDELLAMTLSDVGVMRYLAAMPASPRWGGGFSNALSEILESIKRMLGMERNAATDVIDAFDTLFRAYDTVAVEYSSGGVGWPGAAAARSGPPQSLYETSLPLWDSMAWRAHRNKKTAENPANDAVVSDITLGRVRTVVDMLKLPVGASFAGKFRYDPDWKPIAKQLQALTEKWLPDQRVIWGDALPKTSGAGVNGTILTYRDAHVIGLRDTLGPQKVLRTAVHELGHAVFHRYAREVPADLLAHMREAFNDYVTEVVSNNPNAVNRRFSLTSMNRQGLAGKALKSNEYNMNFDEYTAEQFVKYIEKRAREKSPGKVGLTASAAKAIKELFEQMKAFFWGTANAGFQTPDTPFEQFFDLILQGQELRAGEQAVLEAPAGPVNPLATVGARAKFAERMYEHARAFAARRPVDVARLRTITAKIGGLSDGLVLARSNNPILRMVASLVTETTTGAAGRGPTAAIRKENLKLKLTGNALVDYNGAYSAWKATKRVGILNDVVKGDARVEFNREVYLEILDRRAGTASTRDPSVRRAADALEALFTRALNAQKAASVLGADRLPTDSRGYVPQALDGRKLANATADEIAELVEYLEHRFETVLGWSPKFSREFARFYVQRANARTKNANAKDYAAASQDSLDTVREALREMETQVRDPAIRAEMEQSIRGMGHTKRRLDIDLRDVLPSGKRLLDFYEDDPLWLARRYVNRTSGVIALTEFGIPGDVGVRNLSDVLDFPTNPMERVTEKEREAFERVMAEMLGTPVPGEVRMRHLTAIRLLVNLQRLGGIVWTQAAETVNMVHHLGLVHTLRGVASLPRMLGEVGRVKRGANPNNHVLTHLEQWGGEFGAQVYKMQMPLDPPDNRMVDYAQDDSLFERLVRAGSFAQAKISGFRALMAAQHRMVAEQVTMKMARYAREGASADRWMKDMGIDGEVLGHLQLHINRVARWDKSGRLVSFDITQLPDPRVAEAIVQAVHRGTNQIIQGTFVGETGAWAHNDYLKFLFQLRTFGLTAAEKQWTRAANVAGGGVQGYATAAFLLMAQIALVTPLIAARVHAASIGREDREEFIEKQLDPVNLIRAAMNYTALSGLLGDAIDAVGAVVGGLSEDAEEFLGGRQGTGQGGVADVVPGLGTLDAAGDVVTGNATVYKALKQLPFSNLPYVIPFINLFKE